MPSPRNFAVQSFGELFCGAGGLSLGASLGARDAGYALRHDWAVDFARDATLTYKANFDCPFVLEADIRKLDLRKLGPVEGLAFGFPCNDFSLVGEQRGIDGTFGPLYKYCVRAVERLNPSWFVAENVGGIRSANSGSILPTILQEFAEAGYSIVAHFFRFEEYGVPQARHRVLIVGLRGDIDQEFRVPAPGSLRRSARQALEDPPISPDAANHERTRQSDAVVARLNALRPGQNAFSRDLPENLRLNVRGATISQIYRRLHPDKPAYTVTGSGGGGTHVYHWDEPRALTNRERARLQTFPDDFVFVGGKESVRRQIGMAVPPEGARVVFRALFDTLAGKSYPSIPANIFEHNSESELQTRLL